MPKKSEETLPREVEPAYQLWTHGDVLRARQEAKRLLAQNPSSEAKALAERLLRDTVPDRKFWMAALFSVLVATIVLIFLALRK